MRVDRTPPPIRGALNPASPNGSGGWYRSLRIDWACGDSGGSGIASCPAADTIGDRELARPGAEPGPHGHGRRPGRRLTASAISPAFNFDGIGPRTGEPKVPSAGGADRDVAPFTWSSGGDATSGAHATRSW